MPMKKFHALRNRLLPLFAAAAILFAGSCSKDEAVEPCDADGVLQTRATPEFSMTCKPAAKGADESLLCLKETYRFSCYSFVKQVPPILSLMKPCILTIHASDGSTDGFEIVEVEEEDDPFRVPENPVYVKFTKPGYYHVTADAEESGAYYQKTWTYCVVSDASSITLPDTIRLGEPFDFKFNFSDKRYPAPTIEIRETLFNDPQITVLSNDDRGNFRLRIDQPGKYTISTGLDGRNTVKALIHLYWRPETLKAGKVVVNYIYPDGPWLTYNALWLCDSFGDVYSNLPYRVYFKYLLYNGPVSDGQPVEEIQGEEFCEAGSKAEIGMPATLKDVNHAFLVSDPDAIYPLVRAWHLTIPNDIIIWRKYLQVDEKFVEVESSGRDEFQAVTSGEM